MKKIDFSIRVLGEAEPVAWTGYETTIPGLVVAKTARQNRHIPYVIQPGNTWTVYHELSGYAVMKSSFPTRGDALRFADHLGDIDWTTDWQHVLANRAEYEDVVMRAKRILYPGGVR